MCDLCDRRVLQRQLAAAEDALALVGEYPYWRPKTPVEAAFGDVDAVRVNFDQAEARVVRKMKPVVRKAMDQMVAELDPMLAAGNVAGIAAIQASYTGELAQEILSAVNTNVAEAKRTFLKQAKKQAGQYAARKKPPLKDLETQAAYLEAKSEATATVLLDDVKNALRYEYLAAASKGLTTAKKAQIKAVYDRTGKKCVGQALEIGRESVAAGRIQGYAEVADQVDVVVYTAILDDNVCDVCADADGTTYDDPDEGFASAPNDDCLGGARCRCFTIAVFKR